MTKRVMAIDYGEKRVGLAISDPLNMLANPLECLDNNDHLIEAIQLFINEKGVGTLIIGLPLKLDGSDTKKTQEVRNFYEKLKNKIDIPIEFRDERFSTVAVDRTLGQMGVKTKNRRDKRDVMAACFILQGYLDQASTHP